MVDLVFRLGRRAGILIVRVFLVKVGKYCYNSFLLWAVACHMAFLLAQKALAIHLLLYLLALGDRESVVKCHRLGFDRASAARRAAACLARRLTGCSWLASSRRACHR